VPDAGSREGGEVKGSEMPVSGGRHFLQIPGPTNVPDRVLRVLSRPTIDHRGPEFAQLARTVLDGPRTIFKTSGPVVIYPSSGAGIPFTPGGLDAALHCLLS
jgi:aspartate aminotransferase-like enzyme